MRTRTSDVVVAAVRALGLGLLLCASVPASEAAAQTVCASSTTYVSQTPAAGWFTTISAALQALPNPIVGQSCVMIEDNSTYAEQVTVADFALAGGSITIAADVGMSPAVDPPTTSTAAFVIANASVSVAGIIIAPTNAITYGVLISSSYVQVSSVNVQDAGGSISGAGLALSNWTAVSYTSVTVGAASATAIWLPGVSMASVSYSSAAAVNGATYALWINGASSNTITQSFLINSSGLGTLLDTGSNSNTISLSTMAGGGAGTYALNLAGASSNTITQSYLNNPAGIVAHLDSGSNYNTINLSTVTSRAAGYHAFWLFGASYNTIEQSLIVQPGGDGAVLDTNSNFNTISQSTMTSGGSGYFGLYVTGSSSNTITQSFMTASAGYGAALNAANGNTISQSTAIGGPAQIGLYLFGASSNTITQSYVAGPTGFDGLDLLSNSNYNTISGSTIISHDSTHWGLVMTASSSNTVSQCLVKNLMGAGATLNAGADFNTISQSTITGNAATTPGLKISAAYASVSNSYIQGYDGVDVAGATGTVISGSVLVGVDPAGGVLNVTNGSHGLTLSSVTILGSNVGVALNSYSGAVSISSMADTFTSVGMSIFPADYSPAYAMSGITLSALTPGTTGIALGGGVVVATFTSVDFANANMDVNVDASSLSGASSITMEFSTGPRSGPSYDDDPSEYVHWPSSASYPGCTLTRGVGTGQFYGTISAALAALPASLPAGESCVVIEDGATYNEQVTVRNFTMNGSSIAIFADPAAGLTPIVDPPAGTAAFVIADASISVAGIDIVPTNAVTYGIVISSPNVQLSSVNVIDPGGNISSGGIVTSSQTTVSYSSVTVGGASAAGLWLPGSVMTTVSYSTVTAAGPLQYALWMNGASNNTITHCSFSAPSGYAAQFDSNADWNTISLTKMTGNATGANSYALTLSSASFNTIAQSFMSDSAGGGAYLLLNANDNTIIQSTMTSNAAGYPALYLNGVSSNVVSGDYLQGSTAVWVAGSSWTTIGGSVLVATNTFASALRMDAGSLTLTLSTSVLSAPASGAGVSLGAGDGGQIVLSSNTITGAEYGMVIATQAAGASLSITSMTFANLAAGATALQFTGGTFLSTFTTVSFDASVAVNVDAVPLSTGSSITMSLSTGAKSGTLYSNDPNHYVHWSTAAPVVGITSPIPQALDRESPVSLSSFTGTAFDSASGNLAGVQLRLRNATSIQYWDPTTNLGQQYTFDAIGSEQAWFNAVSTNQYRNWTSTTSNVFTALFGLDGATFTVVARALNSSGYSTTYASNTFVWDSLAPQTGVSSPANGSIISVPVLSGTAVDFPVTNPGLVASVQVRLQRLSDGYYWTGVTGAGTWNPAVQTMGAGQGVSTFVSSWSVASANLPTGADLVNGASYYVTTSGTDNADGGGNVEAWGSPRGSTFTYSSMACFISTVVAAGFNTIQGALNAAGASLAGNFCVSVNGGTYPEQVTVRNIATNGFRIYIASGTGGLATIAPPAASTAAFQIANASVSVSGLNVVPANAITYGVLVSSAFVQVSGVNVQDPGGNIATAGLALSSWTAVSFTSVTVGGAHTSGFLLPGSTMTSVSFSTALANTNDAGLGALFLNGASSNTFTAFTASNASGHGAYLNNSYGNTISQSTAAANGSGYSGLVLVGASTNTITQSILSGPGSYGADLGPGSTYNTIVQSTMTSNSSSAAALFLNGASWNLVTQSYINNPPGTAAWVYNNSNDNTITLSTMTIAGSNYNYGLYVQQASSNTFSADFIQGSTAAYVTGSTGTVISGSVLVATNTAGNALQMDQGSVNLTLSYSALTAGSAGAGVSLPAGDGGQIVLSTNTINGAQYGLLVATQAAGGSLSVVSLNFNALAAGATAVQFVGGTFVSTFTTMGFDPSVGANIDAAALSPGSAITMATPSGTRSGAKFSDDPNHYVSWAASVYPGCTVTENVGAGEIYGTISAAVAALPASLTGPACVVIHDGATYNEQVTVQNVATNGFSVAIFADPGTGLRPAVNPPPGTAAFAIANSSVILQGIDVVPTGAITYGVSVSSPYVSLSSVNVIDPGGKIASAGVLVSNWTTVSYASVTVGGANASGFLLPGTVRATISHSSAAADSSNGYAFLFSAASSNTVTQTFISNPLGSAAFLNPAANYNTITQSRMTSNVAGYYGLILQSASSNTITQSSIVNPVGTGVYLLNSSYNTLGQSTMTTNAAPFWGLWLSGASYNTVTQSYAANALGNATHLLNSNLNTISQSTMTSSCGGCAALDFAGASSNTVTQSLLTGPAGEGAFLDPASGNNAVTQSTITSSGAGFPALFVQGPYNAFGGDYIQGSTAVYAAGSTGTVIGGSVLVATNTAGSALLADLGASGLTLSSSSLSAPPAGAGLTLAAASGALVFATNTITSARYGMVLEPQASGAAVIVTSMTFSNLSAGATAVQFTGGVYVATFTTMFFDLSVAVNINASALSPGSMIAMGAPGGQHVGSAYADDPGGYVYWLNFAYPGCATTLNVGAGQSYATIQSAVNTVPNPLTGPACVVIRDGATYNEQVTVRNFTMNGSTISIFADPASGLTPKVNPPAASTAAFVIANASVSVAGINIAPSNPVTYGVLVSSAYVSISSVNVLDAGGKISAAGVAASSWTTVSFTSVTVGGTHAAGFLLSGSAMTSVSYSSAAANSAGNSQNALLLVGASSNTIAHGYFSNPTGNPVQVQSGSAYNTILQSTMASVNGTALFVTGASYNTFTRNVMTAPSGNGASLDVNANFNTISLSTMASAAAPNIALTVVGSSNTVTQSYMVNTGTAAYLTGGAYGNTISLSTMVSSGAGACALYANAASFNTVTQSVLTSPAGYGAYLVAGANGNALSQDAVMSNSSLSALYLNGVSYNTITQSSLSDPLGYGAYLSTGAAFNTVSLSTMTSGVAGRAALYLTNAASNTVTQSYLGNPAGNAAFLDQGSNGNTLAQSTMTSAAAGYWALALIGASSNTISRDYGFNALGNGAFLGADSNWNTVTLSTFTGNGAGSLGFELSQSSSNSVSQSVLGNPTGGAASLWSNSNANTISQSSIISGAAGWYGLYFNASSSNTVVQSYVASVGTAAFMDNMSNFNAVSQSTIASSGAAAYGLALVGVSSESFSGDYIQGATAAYVSGSTGTAITGSALAAVGATGSALQLGGGSVNLAVSGSTLSAPAGGAGISLAAGNSGALSVSTGTITGARYGLLVAPQAAGAALSAIALNFSGLAAGATAIEFTGGTVVSTFTTMVFDASVGANVDASALSGASSLTMYAALGARAGAAYDDDPGHYVHWTSSNTSYPGCAVVENVSQAAGPFTTIQAAVNALPASLTGPSCVVIRDGATYAEQVNVRNIAMNGNSLAVFADPGSGATPVVTPPIASTAAFVIADASVTVQGFNIVPTSLMTYGVFVSSPYAQVNRVNVQDAGGLISAAGVAASSWTTVSFTSVTVGGGAAGIWLPGSVMTTVSNSTAAASSAGYALWFNGASSNTVVASQFSNSAGVAVRLGVNSKYNAISQSSITSSGAGSIALMFSSASFNTVSLTFVAAPAGNGAYLAGASNFNTISQSTLTSNSASYALYALGSSSNTVTQSYVANPSGYAAVLSTASNGNTISLSTVTSGGAASAGLLLSAASSNTVAQSVIAGAGYGAVLTAGANGSTISLSTVTGGAAGFAALFLNGVSSTTIAQSYVGNPAGPAARLDPFSNYNTISQSVLASNSASYALQLTSASFNTVAQSAILNPAGTGAVLAAGSNGNTISASSVTSGAVGYYPLAIFQSTSNTLSGDSVQGPTGVYVSGSTGTVISGSVLVATSPAGAALQLAGGSANLSLTNSSLFAQPAGTGLALSAWNSGALVLASNTVTGGQYGLLIATQAAGAGLSITSMTFAGLTPGATAMQFTGGLFVSTFTTVSFDASVSANVNASALSPGSSLTMLLPTGARSGPVFADDPLHFVHWLSSSSYPGCAVTENVGSGRPYATIQAGVSALPASLPPGAACVVIEDGATYNEQVTVQNFALNGSSIAIFADPASGLTPTVSPPAGSTAAFVIAEASVTVRGINVVPTHAMTYGVLSSSANTTIDGVKVLDPSGFISAAGVSLPGAGALTRSTVTVQSATGVAMTGAYDVVSLSSITSNSGGVPALSLINASSATIVQAYISNPSAYAGSNGSGALFLSGAGNSTVSLSTVVANSAGSGYAALSLQGSSSSVFTQNVVSNASGIGAHDAHGAGNVFSLDALSGNIAGSGALYLDNASSDAVTQSVLTNPSGIGAYLNSAAGGVITMSTMTGGGAYPGLEIAASTGTTVAQSVVNNGAGVEGGSAFTTISFSTLTSVLIGRNLSSSGASTTTILNSYISGSPAVSVVGSTGTVITGSVLTAATPAGSGLSFGGGSVNLWAASNTITGGALGAGVVVGAGNTGAISLSATVISGSPYGFNVAAQSPGAALVLSGLTFSSLTAGATAVNFGGGVVVSTFTGLVFNGPGLTVNVNASALSPGSSITMASPSGSRSGPGFADDPGRYIHWPLSAAPLSVITSPTAAVLNSVTAISGTAQSFSGTLLAGVFVSVRNLAGGQYWNGTAFVPSATPLFNPAALGAQTPSAGGSAAAWSYPGAALTAALINGASYQIQSQAMDSYTQLQMAVSTFNFVFDITPPSLSIQLPIAGAVYASLPTVSGTSSDSVGVATITLSVQQFGGACFSPALGSFSAACPATFPARGAPTAWNYPGLPWVSGQQYTLVATALDSVGNVTASSTTFTFALSTGLAAGAPGDGQGTASLTPASASGCVLLSATATYTAGPAGIAPGGAIALHIPTGWTQPQGTSAGSPGYVSVVSTGGFNAQFNPAALGNATLGANWVVYVATTSVTPGQTVQFSYQGYPGQGSSAQGAQLFAFSARGAGNGQLVGLSSSPVLNVVPGAPALLSFSPSSPLTVGQNQNTPAMQVQLWDTCGVPTVQAGAPLTVSLQAQTPSGVDANGAFYWTGGGSPVTSVPVPVGSGLSTPFFFTTPAPAGPETLVASAVLGGGAVSIARPLTLLVSSASILGVSVDTGVPGTSTTAVIVENSTSGAAAAFINFTLSDPSLSWEVVVSSNPSTFAPKVADFSGTGNPGRAVAWNGLNGQVSPPQFLPPATYYVQIVAAGGSAVNTALSVAVAPSPSIYGQVTNGPGAKVAASGPNALPGNYAVAGSTGFFQIFGLQSGTAYLVSASSSILIANAAVNVTASVSGVIASDAGTNAGKMAFQPPSLLEVSAVLPFPAPADVSGTVSIHDAAYAHTGAGTIHFFPGGTTSDNGAQSFGVDASSWTAVAVPPGTYEVDVAVPALGITAAVPNVAVVAGVPTLQSIALQKLVNAYGLAVLPAPAAANTWVSVSGQGQAGATAYGGATVPVGASSAVYSLFGLAPGAWTVTAAAPGALPASTSVFVAGSADIGTPSAGGLDLTLKAGGVLTGTLTVSGDTSQSSMTATCPNGAALCVPVTASNPSSFFNATAFVSLATSTTQTSSTFSFAGVADGLYAVSAALGGFTGPAVSVRVSSGTGTAALALGANTSKVTVTVSLPAGVHTPADFKAVSLGWAGAQTAPAAFADMTAGTTIQYFASSAAVLLTGLNADVYQFQAFNSATGMYRALSAPLSSNATASVNLDLSGPTYAVSGTFSLGANLSLPNSSGLSVSVSSVTGLLANTTSLTYCLLGYASPPAISAAHLELLPVGPGGAVASGPLPSAASGCPLNLISPAGASGPVLPNPYMAYAAAIGANGNFAFPGVSPGVYLLRNNSQLDAAGDRLPQFSQTVVVTGTVAGLVFQLGSGSSLSGSVAAPPGVTLTRPMTVNLMDAQGQLVASASVVFNKSNAAAYAFTQVAAGNYTLVLQDSSYPKAYAAAPLQVTLSGQNLSGQNLAVAPSGTIKCRVVVNETLPDGSLQSRLINPSNVGLLPASFQIQAVADPWFQGGLGAAGGPNGGSAPVLDNGNYFVIDGLLPGSYDVRFTAPPGAAGGLSLVDAAVPGVTVTAGSVTDLGFVNLGGGTRISGLVADSSGSPLANVRVHAAPSVRGSGVASKAADAVTDGTGRYVLDGLDPTVRFYDVFAAFRGAEVQGESLPPYQQTISPSVDLSTVSVLNFSLAPAPYSVSGRVVAAPGGPALGAPVSDGVSVPGALVYFQKSGVIPVSNPIADIRFQTDYNGAFTIPSVTTGTYVMIAASLGYSSLSRLVTITTASVDLGTLTMTQGATLTGTLTNPDGSNPTFGQVAQILAVTPDLTNILVGSLTTNPNTQTVGGYTIAGFKTGLSYRVILLDAQNGTVAPPEAASVVFSSTGSMTLNIVYRAAPPLVVAYAGRQGTGFQVEFDLSQPLRQKTADDENLSAILTPLSAAGTLSTLTLSQDRARLRAFYTPGVSESSFTLHLRGYSTLVDPSSLDPVNPQFIAESTVTFFTGIDALGQTNVAELEGGDVLVQGDSGRVTLPPGAFNVTVASAVLVTLQVAGEPLTGGAGAAGLPAAAGRLKSLRYSPQSYPSEILAAAAAVPPSVSPLSAFYNIFLPLGVNTALTKPAQLTVAYSTGVDPSTLNLYWYNPAASAYILQQDVTGAPPVINTAERTITVNVNHFSTFVLFNSAQAVIAGGTGAEVLQADNFPNPFDLGPKTVTPLHAGGSSCSPSCSINGTMIGISVPPDLSGSATIRIFNVAGTLVRSIGLGPVQAGGFYYQNWDGTNDSGRAVASGAYIGELKIGTRTTFFKMAVIKGSGL